MGEKKRERMWKGMEKMKLLLTARVLLLLLLLDCGVVAFAEGIHDSDDDDDDVAIFFSSLMYVNMEVVRDDPLLKSTQHHSFYTNL